jgi:hypothetical protein
MLRYSDVTPSRRCYAFRPDGVDSNLTCLFHPWKREPGVRHRDLRVERGEFQMLLRPPGTMSGRMAELLW